MLDWQWDLWNRLQNGVIVPLDAVQRLAALPDDADLATVRARVNDILKALRTESE